jgi:uncharacterized protein YoxC
MGWLRKKGKQIAGAFRKVGRRLKKGLGKLAKAFGKLGPLGSVALSFILPGIGGAIGSWFGGLPNSNFLVKIVNGMKGAFGAVKKGMGTVFNKVTDAIEWSMNKVGGVVGKGEVGSNFRNFVSDVTGGFIEKSEFATEKQALDLTEKASKTLTDKLDGITPEDNILKQDAKIVDAVTEKKDTIFKTLRDDDLSFKEGITSSREYAAYKPIEATRMAGATINEGEAAYEAQVNYLKARKSDYFKGQADYQLSAVEQQNYSHVGDMPTFVDYSNFNASQDPAPQYLAYRGITGNVNPVDIGGYGFDYEQFLRAQLS